MSESVYAVAVNAPLPSLLDYKSSEGLGAGTKVKVPLGSRQVSGVVFGPGTDSGEFELKNILEADPELEQLPETFLEWCRWIAGYYQYPIGSVVHHAFPPLKKKGKTRKASAIPEVAQDVPPQLTTEQQQVLSQIEVDQFDVHLLHGVTGSGKTEVYLNLLEQTMQLGKSGLVLVPEISLTPQLLSRFAARFGENVAVLHSQLTPRERTNQWWNVIEGRSKVLIGARSALFCPIPNLGLIVIDEEHESSYKQDEKFRYHARDAAIVRAKMQGIPIVLGSATPSLESFQNAKTGKYRYHKMVHRTMGQSLPNVTVVDLRSAEKDPELPFWMSKTLFEKLSYYLDAGMQAACFLNRRGMAQSVLCTNCGAQVRCPNCDIGLTLHNSNQLVCHYCGYYEKYKQGCSECGDGQLEALGLGTERLEEDLLKLFPNKTLRRMDRDEVQSREDLENLIFGMQNGEIDLLIGTQMISKGLDFPNLRFMAIVMADISLNIPDFRSSEKTFQLLTQVAGRAGRHGQGEVVIQTYNPDHFSIVSACKHDFLEFAEQELVSRQELEYPPFSHIVMIKSLSISQSVSRRVIERALQRAHLLKDKFSDEFGKLSFLGPAECPLFKVRNQFRYMALIKGPSPTLLKTFLRSLLADQKWVEAKGRIIVDVDPINMM